MNGSIGIVASQHQTRKNDAKRVLERGRGEAKAVELEEIAIVEAVTE